MLGMDKTSQQRSEDALKRLQTEVDSKHRWALAATSRSAFLYWVDRFNMSLRHYRYTWRYVQPFWAELQMIGR
jgi:hypothetical protein